MLFILAQATQRLDWFGYGVSSISRTGAFIACLAVACWVLCAIPRKWGFGAALISSSVFVYFLIQTQSRGALIAFCAGMLIVFLAGKIEWNRWRALAVLALAIAGCAHTCETGFSRRVTQMATLQSSSANVRGHIYLSGVKMLADAPDGWGVWNAAEVYRQWYQTPGDGESYLSLLNSHLNFMVERGVWWRLVYCVFWSFAFWICVPYTRSNVASVLLSVWVCFGLAAIFSNVANYWVLWIVPLLALIEAIFLHRRRFLRLSFWGACMGCGVLCFGGLYGMSMLLPEDMTIQKEGDVVYLGQRKTDIVLFNPSTRALGSVYGQELREAMRDKDASSVAVIMSRQWPEGMQETSRLVVSGEFPVDVLRHGRGLVLLNAMPDNSDALAEGLKGKHALVVVGDMADWRVRRFWQEWLEKNPTLRFLRIPGAGDYIPDWPRFLFEKEVVP